MEIQSEHACGSRALPRISLTPEEAATSTGFSVRRIFQAIKDEKLTARKAGKATIIEFAELSRWVGTLPTRGRTCARNRISDDGTRQRRHRAEDALQHAIVEHYRQRAAPGVFMFAVPNGGFRRPVEAAILQATGTVAGIPDTIWIKDGQVYALELKAPGGRLTPAQEGVLVALRKAGATATHAHGLDQALQILERWELLRGRAQ